MMVPEEKVETALDFLRSNAAESATAKATAVYMREWIKTVKAKCALKSVGLSSAAAETKALVDPEYLASLQALKEAVEADAFFSFKREAASAVIEAWRTEQATLRAENKAYQ